VVCGDDGLAHRLVDELTNQYATAVTVVVPSRRRNHAPQLAALRHVRMVESDHLDTAAFLTAKLTLADGLALVGQNDIENIHAALVARELHPEVRLVIRMLDMSLAHGVRQLLGDCALLSDAAMAAPHLVATALDEVAPSFVRAHGRTLYIARRAEVHRHDVVCGIATTAGDAPPEILPADEEGADLVLAGGAVRVEGARVSSVPSTGRQPESTRVRERSPAERARRRARRRIRLHTLLQALRLNSDLRRHERRRARAAGGRRQPAALLDSRLRTALICLAALFASGVVAIGLIDGVNPWHAVYTSLFIALGAGDPDLQVGLARQLTQAAVALAGVALVPTVTAAIVNVAVNARLAAVLWWQWGGHIVVIGLGDVGTRVLRYLHERGLDVVAIEQSETSQGATHAEELGIPLIVGDPSHEDTLRRASVRNCRALLVLPDSDLTNVAAALHARKLQPGVRVVLRIFEHDLARRVEQAFDLPISRSVSSLAAPVFAAALLRREVVTTIAVGRRVLVMAQLSVAAGSALDGQQVVNLTHAGEVRVIALVVSGDPTPTWCPPPAAPIRAGDRVLVLANRAGLTRVLARSHR
jgi:Trk K+ transport system NAD-binding subunit